MSIGLPVLDLGPLRAPTTPGAEAELARQIREACTTLGFFYVGNHGVPEGLVEDVFAIARAFYAQSESEKRKIALGAHTHWRGWTTLGSEVTRGKRDWHECVDIMNEHRGDGTPARSPLQGANVWPASPPSFRSIAWAYFEAMRTLGQTLLAGMSLSCGFERDFFAERFTVDPWCLLRILRYPEQPNDSNIGIGIGEHTDYGCLTLLAATEPGLWVRTTGGTWIEAPPRPGTFVCNLGDAMETWTYGVYKATPHRVVAARERIAIPFFFDPSLDAVIEPLESFRGAGIATSAPFEYGPYLLAAYERSYPELAARATARP